MTRALTLVVVLTMGCGSGATSDAGIAGAGDGGPGPDAAVADAGGAPVTVLLTPDGSAWYDPEVVALAPEALFTYQDERGRVFVARVDPSTGRPGEATLVGQGAAPLTRTYNGPEFGVDRGGWALYYTRRAADGGFEAARGRLVDGGASVDVLPGEGLFTPLASKDPTASSTRLVAIQRGAAGWGTALWLDMASASLLNPLFFLAERTDADLRWVNGTFLIVSSTCAAYPGELCLIDTAEGSTTRVSQGEGAITSPYGWRAPEADGGLQVLALLGDTTLRVWRREAGAWTVAGSLGSPRADAGLPNLGSPEPFVAGGRSYVSIAVSSVADVTPGQSEQQIWVMGLDPREPFAARCDDGLPGPRSRVDPETLVVGHQVYVYYYTIDTAGSRVSLCTLTVP